MSRAKNGWQRGKGKAAKKAMTDERLGKGNLDGCDGGIGQKEGLMVMSDGVAGTYAGFRKGQAEHQP